MNKNKMNGTVPVKQVSMSSVSEPTVTTSFSAPPTTSLVLYLLLVVKQKLLTYHLSPKSY